MPTRNIIRGTIGFVMCSALIAPAASAQLANASATTFGVAGNATATARGIAAISVNPAGLGMPGSGFTLSFLPLELRSGIDPITLKDLKDVEGEVLTPTMKEDWLTRAEAAGGQSGAVGVDISALALSMGKFGLQLSTLVGADLNVSPDVLEVLLYGNAGRTGSASDISLAGSTATGYVVTTAGVSAGFPLSSASGSMAIGGTLKYSVGNAVLAGKDQGGTITGNPVKVDLRFPVIMPPEEDDEFNHGSGIGVDLGFQATRGKVSFGGAVLNAFNTFKWKTDKLVYRPLTVLFDGDNNESDSDEQPISGAPADLKLVIEDMKFDPILSLGVGYDVSDVFTVSADFRNRFGDGMAVTPKLHLGAGAEFRGLKVLHLRAGAAIITDGMELAGGASLVLGPVSLSAAGGLRKGDLADTSMAQFGLSFGGR